MAYVIAEPCIGTKDTACVDACPVDCIHPKKDEVGFADSELLYIDPQECIDCGACVPVCPVSAIFDGVGWPVVATVNDDTCPDADVPHRCGGKPDRRRSGAFRLEDSAHGNFGEGGHVFGIGLGALRSCKPDVSARPDGEGNPCRDDNIFADACPLPVMGLSLWLGLSALTLLLILAGWTLLQTWLLPRLGVPT